ncbi:MAG: hypothetical protein NXI04_18895 [Planctomycetaceae bacterium]|nr:hypothetical protein [Planctomycetaceae bacterium]
MKQLLNIASVFGWLVFAAMLSVAVFSAVGETSERIRKPAASARQRVQGTEARDCLGRIRPAVCLIGLLPATTWKKVEAPPQACKRTTVPRFKSHVKGPVTRVTSQLYASLWI